MTERLDQLEARLRRVEQQSARMRVAKADLLRLQARDILVVKVNRPLASSECAEIARGFKEVFAQTGLSDVHAVVLGGVDQIDLSVIRRAELIAEPCAIDHERERIKGLV